VFIIFKPARKPHSLESLNASDNAKILGVLLDEMELGQLISPSTSGLLLQSHSSIASYSLIHVLPIA
jgi:hypothetical protein